MSTSTEHISVIDPNCDQPRTFNVYFADGIPGSAATALRSGGDDIKVASAKTTSAEALREILKLTATDALVIRSATKLTGKTDDERKNIRELLGKSNISLVIRAGIGVDNIDLEVAADAGVVVENTPDGNVDAVVHKTLHDYGTVMSPQWRAQAALRRRERNAKITWSMAEDPYRGKTFGVVGVGRIGRGVAAEIMKRGGTVIGHDIAPFTIDGVRACSLDELCNSSDVITVHASKGPSDHRSLIGPEQFARMKQGVVILNEARGGLVDEGALLSALQKGRVAACVLDVFTEEDPVRIHEDDVRHTLINDPRVLPSLHVGANCAEAQERNGVDAAEQIKRFAAGRGIRNACTYRSVELDMNGHSGDGDSANAHPAGHVSYRLIVRNENRQGVHRDVHRAIAHIDGVFNVDDTNTKSDSRGHAVLLEEISFRPDTLQLGRDLPHDTAQSIVSAVRAVDGVLGFTMLKVEQS